MKLWQLIATYLTLYLLFLPFGWWLAYVRGSLVQAISYVAIMTATGAFFFHRDVQLAREAAGVLPRRVVADVEQNPDGTYGRRP